ncbi:MAG: hypothetical protein J6U04_09540 [Salinivirgaceae bacterium]|nr:hypothetical protein [Salinivirgaceae bacterium]
MLTDKHKEQIRNIIMEDYDVRPSLAALMVDVFENATKRVIDADCQIREQRKQAIARKGE